MNTQDARRNIKFYRLYTTFREPLLWGPILISCLVHLGKMKLSEIYFMESVVLLGTIFLQIPTGAMADLIGRKKTIIIGSTLYLLSMIWFAFISSPFGVWGANILCMTGLALCDGADSAFLYDSLKGIGEGPEYKKVDGQATGNKFLMIGIFSLLTGYLAQISLRLPLLLSIPGVLFSTIMPFFFKEPPMTEKSDWKEHLKIMKTSVSFVLGHKEVKWIIGFTTLIGVTSKIWFFTYNPYFELVKLDLKFYGFVFFILNIIAWFFSRYAHKLSGMYEMKTMSIFIVLLIGLPILFMGSLVTVFAVCMVFPQNIVRGFMRPIFGEFLNRHLDSKNRATTLSVQQTVGGLAQFIALGGFGFMLVSFGLPVCLQTLGAIVLVCGLCFTIKYKKIFG